MNEKIQEMIDRGLFHRNEKGEIMSTPKGHLVPDHSEWADWIIENFNVVTDEGVVYIYEISEGRFVSGKERIKSWMEGLYRFFSTRDFSEIFEHIKNRSYLSESEKKAATKRNSKLVLLLNGVYDIENRKLVKFSPEFFFKNAPLQVTYDPDVDCPEIKKFIKEIVRDVDVPLVQEMIGYCFLREMPYHKAFMFIGDGRNGKSTLINLIIETIGIDNISQLSLQQISSGGFILGYLKDKMVNVYSDLPASALRNSGFFKIITGGDWVTVDRKFKAATSFLNYAKLIFSCNKLPEAKDDTTAFFRRWILLNFPNEFPPEKADPNILDKLTTDQEKSGLFNWALEGLFRLFDNKDFSYSKTTDEVKEQYERLSNSLLSFVKDWVLVDVNSSIEKGKFYMHYAQYCRDFNLPIKSKSIVGRELPSHVAVSDSRTSRKRAWLGIKFKEETEEKKLSIRAITPDDLDKISLSEFKDD
ncbi:MAG: DNA primase family protein [Candidatus Hodarchaeales archaeon]